MRDENYGFYALEHRFRVLNGQSVSIDESRKFDLSRMIVDLYGAKYVDDPKLKNLLLLNGALGRDFLSGEEEAQAFTNGEFYKLHLSTLRKCDSFETILDLSISNKLKTKNGIIKKYGISLELVSFFLREYWLINFLTFAFAAFGFIQFIYWLLDKFKT